MREIGKFVFKALGWILGIGLVIGAVLEVFFVDRVVVPHNAMAPTMLAGDTVLMWNRVGEPAMGDILVCEHPSRVGEYVVGRVVGKSGMVVRAVRGQLEVAGTIPDYDLEGVPIRFLDVQQGRTDEMIRGIEKLGNTDHPFFRRRDAVFTMRSTEVQNGVFLLGDNRTLVGQDSRTFGTVDPAKCIGKVFMRWDPTDQPGAELGHAMFDMIR